MILAHTVPPFATRGLSGYMDEEDGLVTKVGTSKKHLNNTRVAQ